MKNHKMNIDLIVLVPGWRAVEDFVVHAAFRQGP
jgi:hypothetical protein